MSHREPYAWALALTAAWLAVVLVIVAAASGDDPTIEAGTVVMLLPVAAFGCGVAAAVRRRAPSWVARFAAAAGVALSIAYLVAIAARGETDAIYLVPLIAIVAGVVLWLSTAAGWALGAIARSGLDARPDRDPADPEGSR